MCVSRTPTQAARPRARDAAAPRPSGSRLCEIELLEDVEQHQRRQTLPVRRQFDARRARDSSSRSARRRRPDGARDLPPRASPPRGLNGRRDVRRDRTLVERLRAARRDRLQGRGERRQAASHADRRAIAPSTRKCFAEPACGVSLSTVLAQSARRRAVRREAVLGVADRGLQHAVEAEAAVRLEDRLPRIDRARHRNGMRRCRRDLARQALRASIRSVVAARRRRGRSRCSPRPAASGSPTGRSNRRRCRSSPARPRTASRQPQRQHRRPCRRPSASRSPRGSRADARWRPCLRAR